MNTVELLQLCLSVNLFFVCMSVFAFVYSNLEKLFNVNIKASLVLRLQYLSCFTFFLFCLFKIFLPQKEFSQSLLGLVKAKEENRFSLVVDPLIEKSKDIFIVQSLPVDLSRLLIQSLLLFCLLIAGILLLRSFLKISNILKEAFCVRNILGFRLYFSDTCHEAFSFWSVSNLNVLVPSYLAHDKEALKVVVAHEIQHHRQGDTRWAYVFSFLNTLFFWNPFLRFYATKLSEIQEFACDEVLVDRKHVPPRAYARHLFQVATRAHSAIPECTTAFAKERSLLRRRIEKMTMINQSNDLRRKTLSSVYVLAVSFCFFVAAWGTRGILQNKQVSLEQAQTLAKNVESDTFPLPVNEAVLESINFYVGTEQGREKIKGSLERMESYKPLLEKKLQEYSLPDDLLAIPIVESGYKNIPDKNTKGWGAGLWMFIRQTARNYGLRVDKTVDERMNEELLTDAAMRYLNANMLRFKDWHLALLAYNGGEGAVQELIDKTKSRNPWDLVKGGAESDKGYLSKVIAAAIIIKNPQLMQ